MRRHIQGLHEADPAASVLLPDSLYLVRVARAQYGWHPEKPYYILRLLVIGPQHFAGRTITGRIYCTRRALWKLNWFLRDFGYDTNLLGQDEIDEKSLVGLQGIVKIGHVGKRHYLRQSRRLRTSESVGRIVTCSSVPSKFCWL